MVCCVGVKGIVQKGFVGISMTWVKWWQLFFRAGQGNVAI